VAAFPDGDAADGDDRICTGFADLAGGDSLLRRAGKTLSKGGVKDGAEVDVVGASRRAPSAEPSEWQETPIRKIKRLAGVLCEAIEMRRASGTEKRFR